MAAPQKRSHTVKPGGQQVKHECGCGRCEYLPRGQARLAAEHGGDICSRCSGRFLPAHIQDCADLAPNLLHLHGDYVEDLAADETPQWGYGASEGYCECTYRMPAGADPDYWVCPRCRKVNERNEDGTMGSFTAAPFSPEVEKAHGLATKVRRDRKAKRLPEPDRYRTVPDDIPF